MVDRVKYFMLGLLFLVVAGVIAYDRWNAPAAIPTLGDASEHATRVNAEVNGAKPPDLSFIPKPDRNQKAKEDAERLRGRTPDTTQKRNKKDPDAKPFKKEPAKKKQPAKLHIVKSGDSLERIALHYYNTRKGIDWIVRANGLRDRNRIYLNQKLIIPARKESVSTKKKAGKIPKKAPKVPARYVVKEGDGNLYNICRRFYGTTGQGSRIARIMELNQLWSADVKTGAILILPPK